MDIRNLIYIIRNDPTKSIEECKKIFDKKFARETVIMALALPTDLVNRVNQLSKKQKIKPTQYVMKLIEGACHE